MDYYINTQEHSNHPLILLGSFADIVLTAAMQNKIQQLRNIACGQIKSAKLLLVEFLSMLSWFEIKAVFPQFKGATKTFDQ